MSNVYPQSIDSSCHFEFCLNFGPFYRTSFGCVGFTVGENPLKLSFFILSGEVVDNSGCKAFKIGPKTWINGVHWGKNPQFIPNIHIFKTSFFTMFTMSKYHFSPNSQFQNVIFHKIHTFKISFFTEIHIFQSLTFPKIHIFKTLFFTKLAISQSHFSQKFTFSKCDFSQNSQFSQN